MRVSPWINSLSIEIREHSQFQITVIKICKYLPKSIMFADSYNYRRNIKLFCLSHESLSNRFPVRNLSHPIHLKFEIGGEKRSDYGWSIPGNPYDFNFTISIIIEKLRMILNSKSLISSNYISVSHCRSFHTLASKNPMIWPSREQRIFRLETEELIQSKLKTARDKDKWRWRNPCYPNLLKHEQQ